MTEWDGKNRREKESWHLDKRFSIANIFTLISIIGTVLYWAHTNDVHIALMKNSIHMNELAIVQVAKRGEESLDRLEKRNIATLTEIKASLLRIEQKVDGK